MGASVWRVDIQQKSLICTDVPPRQKLSETGKRNGVKLLERLHEQTSVTDNMITSI